MKLFQGTEIYKDDIISFIPSAGALKKKKMKMKKKKHWTCAAAPASPWVHVEGLLTPVGRAVGVRRRRELHHGAVGVLGRAAELDVEPPGKGARLSRVLVRPRLHQPQLERHVELLDVLHVEVHYVGSVGHGVQWDTVN